MGSKILKTNGWTIGKGIGAQGQGIPVPIVLESQTNKRGLGFFEAENLGKKQKKKEKTILGEKSRNGIFSLEEAMKQDYKAQFVEFVSGGNLVQEK